MTDESKPKDPYKILGLDPKKRPTQDDIKSAYRKLAMKYHPDHNENKENSDEFQEISWAYSILGDERKRERYDRFGFLEPDVNELKQGVQSTIRAYLNQLIDQGERIFGIDVINQLAGFCQAQKLLAKKEIEVLKKRENHLKKVMSKFRKKKQLSYDFITNIFIEDLNNIYQSITTNMKTIRILEETIIVVKSYDFEFDKTQVNKIVPDEPLHQTAQKVNLGSIFEHAARAKS